MLLRIPSIQRQVTTVDYQHVDFAPTVLDAVDVRIGLVCRDLPLRPRAADARGLREPSALSSH